MTSIRLTLLLALGLAACADADQGAISGVAGTFDAAADGDAGAPDGGDAGPSETLDDADDADDADGTEVPAPDSGPDVVPPLEVEGFCRLGFCWMHPRPHGLRIKAVSGPPSQRWTVGERGLVAWYGGGQWHSHWFSASDDLRDMHDGWLVGARGGVWAQTPDGSFAAHTSPTDEDLLAVQAYPDGRVLVAGPGGLWLRLEDAWSHIDDRPFGDIAIADNGQTWVLGQSGLVSERDDNAEITEIARWVIPEDALAIATLGDQVWVGGIGLFKPLDGDNRAKDGFASYQALWPLAQDDIWIVADGYLDRNRGHSWSLTDWESAVPKGRLGFGGSDENLWVFGAFGHVARWRPELPTPAWQALTELHTQQRLDAVWAWSREVAWVGGQGALLQHGPTGWSDHSALLEGGRVTVLAGSGPDDVWVGANLWIEGVDPLLATALHHWNGESWTTTLTDCEVESFAALGPDAAFWVGECGTRHWDGSTWAPAPDAGARVMDVEGTSGFATDGASLWRIDATSWTKIEPGPAFGPDTPYAISALDALPDGGVLIGGIADGPFLRRWHPDEVWTELAPPPAAPTRIWLSGTGDLWVLDPSAQTLHLLEADAAGWTTPLFDATPALLDFDAPSGDALWVVGDDAAVLRAQ